MSNELPLDTGNLAQALMHAEVAVRDTDEELMELPQRLRNVGAALRGVQETVPVLIGMPRLKEPTTVSVPTVQALFTHRWKVMLDRIDQMIDDVATVKDNLKVMRNTFVQLTAEWRSNCACTRTAVAVVVDHTGELDLRAVCEKHLKCWQCSNEKSIPDEHFTTAPPDDKPGTMAQLTCKEHRASESLLVQTKFLDGYRDEHYWKNVVARTGEEVFDD